MSNDLTDTQEKIVRAVSNEIKGMTGEVLEEIRRLRDEQTEKHTGGEGSPPGSASSEDLWRALVERDHELETIRVGVRRLALGLLKLVGIKKDDLFSWWMKKEGGKKH